MKVRWTSLVPCSQDGSAFALVPPQRKPKRAGGTSIRFPREVLSTAHRLQDADLLANRSDRSRGACEVGDAGFREALSEGVGAVLSLLSRLSVCPSDPPRPSIRSRWGKQLVWKAASPVAREGDATAPRHRPTISSIPSAERSPGRSDQAASRPPAPHYPRRRSGRRPWQCGPPRVAFSPRDGDPGRGIGPEAIDSLRRRAARPTLPSAVA